MTNIASHLSLAPSQKHLVHKKTKRNKTQTNTEEKESTFDTDTTLSDWDQIEGLEIIAISPNTQLFVGCKIGEDVTPERPWIFVEKKKIEEDIATYQKSSEFIDFERRIRKYPEPQMLLGTCSWLINEKVDFYLCIDVTAKECVVQLLKKEHDKILGKILECMNRVARPWTSLGSEEEVVGMMNKNNRCLFVVELQPLYPYIKETAKFKIRTPREYKNAYVEILPGRFSCNSVMRKCVDRSTQSTGCKVNKRIQVVIKGFADKSTQYFYKFPKTPQKVLFGKIQKFLNQIIDEISSTLVVNDRINNFKNDYKDLVKKPISTRMLRPMEISSHQDIIHCKNKKISYITWNTLISGVIAAAYVNQPSFCLTSEDPSLSQISDSPFEVYLVLVWTQNQLRPKLYLHAIREVTCLSFCPYNENILVGGCSNGQILAWDISNKLSLNEHRTGCSKEEYQVHMYIENLTNWIKKIPGENHIFPVIISALNTGHLTAISSICWVPPNHYISRYGRYEDSTPENCHMQILTSSLSGSRILVYDLIPDEKVPTNKKAKVTRLSRRPFGLRPPKTVLSEMKYNLHPKYQMNIIDPSMQQVCHPIMRLIMRNDRYIYHCENPETIENTEQTSYFKILDLMHPFDRTMTFLCSTGYGTLQIASWEGHNYDQGLMVNSERCKVRVFKVVHDGPVLVCEANPFFPDVLLTIGGTILAIWNTTKSQSPLLWRKAKCRYCSGMWSYIHPLAFVMIRVDIHYEYWNLSILSHFPITSFKHKGTMLLKLYSDSRKYHVRKKTFITSDEVGAFKVFTLPSWEKNIMETSDRIESLEFLDRQLQMKEYVENLKRKLGQQPIKIEEPIEKIEAVPSIYNPPGKPPKNKETYHERIVKQWQIKQEREMRKELLAKKHIRIEDIDKRMEPIEKKLNIKKLQDSKILDVLSAGEEPVRKILKSISATFIKVRRNIEVGYPQDVRVFVKKQYKLDYDALEKEVLDSIKAKPYRVDFDWKLFLNRRTATKVYFRTIMAAHSMAAKYTAGIFIEEEYED